MKYCSEMRQRSSRTPTLLCKQLFGNKLSEIGKTSDPSEPLANDRAQARISCKIRQMLNAPTVLHIYDIITLPRYPLSSDTYTTVQGARAKCREKCSIIDWNCSAVDSGVAEITSVRGAGRADLSIYPCPKSPEEMQ